MKGAINFSEDYDKLQHPLFTTIRFYTYIPGKIYPICLNEQPKGFALLIHVYFCEMSQLNASFIEYDTKFKGKGATPSKFYEVMERFYGKLEGWNGKDTILKVLLLLWVEKKRKIKMSLDIF